jgi:hypothetical protein
MREYLPKPGVDHTAFVDDEQRGRRERAVVGELEQRAVRGFGAGVDQAVEGGGTSAAFRAHNVGGLAREGGKHDGAVDAFGNVFGERGLAGAGVAE